MKVDITRHRDASEPDARGYYDYFNEYDVITFTDGAIAYIAQSYTDEPQCAAMMAREESGQRHLLIRDDLADPLFRAAEAWLRAHGKLRITWLSREAGGYIETKDLT